MRLLLRGCKQKAVLLENEKPTFHMKIPIQKLVEKDFREIKEQDVREHAEWRAFSTWGSSQYFEAEKHHYSFQSNRFMRVSESHEVSFTDEFLLLLNSGESIPKELQREYYLTKQYKDSIECKLEVQFKYTTKSQEGPWNTPSQLNERGSNIPTCRRLSWERNSRLRHLQIISEVIQRLQPNSTEEDSAQREQQLQILLNYWSGNKDSAPSRVRQAAETVERSFGSGSTKRGC